MMTSNLERVWPVCVWDADLLCGSWGGGLCLLTLGGPSGGRPSLGPRLSNVYFSTSIMDSSSQALETYTMYYMMEFILVKSRFLIISVRTSKNEWAFD